MNNHSNKLIDYFESVQELEPVIKDGFFSREIFLNFMLKVSKFLYQDDKPLELLKYYCSYIDYKLRHFDDKDLSFRLQDIIHAAMPCKQYSLMILRIYQKLGSNSNTWVDVGSPIKEYTIEQWMDTTNILTHVSTHVRFIWSMACACSDHTLELTENEKLTLEEFRRRSKETLLYLKDILKLLGYQGSLVS